MGILGIKQGGPCWERLEMTSRLKPGRMTSDLVGLVTPTPSSSSVSLLTTPLQVSDPTLPTPPPLPDNS